uniref:Uncharacterized protein n=1 Tax=viral metagenome TaxID=1070528 RepID=A0A6M3LGE3_9ZZZZ
MDIIELKEWLKEHIIEEERNLEMIKESNRKMPMPDIVARRVTETQIMDYRNILRRLE